jgi:hypothetical protein
MSLQIVRPVVVKVIVTEHLKEKLVGELQSALQKTDAELQQIELQGKRLLLEVEKSSPGRLSAIREQVDTERQKRQDTRRELLERIKAVANLQVGHEHTHSTVDSLVEVQVGDDWNQLSAREIVLKDDRVVEIR